MSSAATYTVLEPGSDRVSVFETVEVPLETDHTPLAKSTRLPATSISFRWTPGDYDFDYHCAPRRRLIIVLEGTLEVVSGNGVTRRYGVGDMLVVADTQGSGHISRAAGGQPFRSALINLDETLVHDRMQPLAAPDEPRAVEVLRTRDGPDGRSVSEYLSLPYVTGGAGGRVTRELPLSGFQFVFAPADLDYAWHRAPQRQFVIPLTGGMEIENGTGGRFAVPPGGLYAGEDVAGDGHITRALAGRSRLCVFAHLSPEARSHDDVATC